MRILACLIDDNKVFQIVTKRLLESFPHKIKDVIQFYDGKDALDYFVENKDDTELLPDLVFLDLNMPIMNGWEFLEEIQNIKLSKHIKIHICTSSVSPLDIERAKEYTMVDRYLVKPINMHDLGTILEEYLNMEVG